MEHRVVVINPNSDRRMTSALDDAVSVHRSQDMRIECVTLAEAPPAIVTHSDVAATIAPMQSLVAAESATASAFVIACFYDPGLRAVREATAKPVFGMAESSFYTAMSLVDRFGIISTMSAAGARHVRYIRELGISDRYLGYSAIEVPVSQLQQDGDETLRRLVRAGQELRSRGAEAVITACAGMACFRSHLQAQLRMPVIDPTLAAVGLAAGAARAGFL